MEIFISMCKEGKKKLKDALKKVDVTSGKKKTGSEDEGKSKDTEKERSKEEFM